jgi:hypothetical protein
VHLALLLLLHQLLASTMHSIIGKATCTQQQQQHT